MYTFFGKFGVSFLILLGFFYLNISHTHAETNVTDTITKTIKDIAQKKFNSETGLDKLKDIKDIDAGKIANKTVKYVRGDVPSVLMGNLLTQIGLGRNMRTDGLFKLYLKKRPYSGKVIRSCDLAANQKLQGGIFNARVKAHFSPWVDIAWDAIKNIAGGGKSIAELIAKNTKAKVEALIKDTLFGKAEPKIEVVTIPHYDSCDSVTKVTWDPVNMRIIIVTTGDCGCKLYKTDGGQVRLKDFKVVVSAPVTVQSVKIEDKTRFFGIFGAAHSIKAQYRVGKLSVTTGADCDCNQVDDTVGEPEEKSFSLFGFFKGIKDAIVDFFTGRDKLEDVIIDETDESEDDTEDRDEDTQEKNKDESEDESSDDEGDDKSGEEQPEDESQEQPFTCGDNVSIGDGNTVATFPYRETLSDDINFSCNNSCASNQICAVLPDSVGASRDSCVYCKQLCEPGEFITQASCEANLGEDQQCIGSETNSCYAIQDIQKPTSLGSCEKSIKLLLDEYVGWFDPPLSFSSNAAVFLNGPYRCLSEADLKQFHTDLVEQGVEAYHIRAMCPSLKHVSTESIDLGGTGKGALCNTKTLFSF